MDKTNFLFRSRVESEPSELTRFLFGSLLLQDEMKLLARVATAHSKAEGDIEALAQLAKTPGWLTLISIVKAAAEGAFLSLCLFLLRSSSSSPLLLSTC